MALKNWEYAAILIGILFVAAVYMGYININGITPPNAGPQVTAPDRITNPAGQVTATKQLKVVVIDELAGGAVDGTTNAVVVYDSDGKTTLETLTLSSGAATTANSYPSGKQLVFKYYYDTTIDSYKFWSVTVPTMSAADAESLTTNNVVLRTREAGVYTDSLITSAGTTITDGLEFNLTGTGNDTLTATYSMYETTDNCGYPSFHDTIYNVDLRPMIWATLSGGQYDQISLSGFDGSFAKGSTQYYYKYITDNDISKYKVGNDYVYPGANAFSFSWNAVGFANTTTTETTLQLWFKVYSSADYMQQYGAYGPYSFTGSEQTVLFYTN